MAARFSYPLSKVTPFFAAMLFAFVGESCVAILAISRSSIDSGYLYFSSVMFFLAIASAISGILYYLKHLPISIEQDGIRSYAFGTLNKFLSWSEVKGIEKRRGLDLISGKIRDFYFVRSLDKQIQFDDWLLNLKEFLDLLNSFATQHGIQIVFVDNSPLTRS